MLLLEKADLLARVTQLPFIIVSDENETVVVQDYIPNSTAWVHKLDKLFSSDKSIECILTKNLMCISRIRCESINLYIGPVSKIKCDIYRVKNLLNEYRLPKDALDATLQYFNKTGSISISRFADIAALAYYVMTGDSVNPSDLITYHEEFDSKEKVAPILPIEEEHNGQEMEIQLFSHILLGRPIE